MLNLGAVWGIDVGDSALKAVKLKRVGKQVALLDFQIIRYSDLSGEVGARREALLPQAIAALQAAGLGRERCVVSIAPQAVFNRFISLPPVDKRRIPEIVLYEARQQIPFNLSEVVWAYESVRKEFIPGEEIEIGLFAVKREVIDAYLAELAPIWKQLHGVQVGPLGLYNFIRYEMSVEQPIVVIDIGAQSTDLLIIDGQKFWLRNLPIAGNSFTSVLEKRLNIPRAEAEKLKFSVAESRHRKKLLEVLRPAMRDLVAEIQRSVGYYKSLAQAVKFEEILVTGEGYQLFGLDRFLSEQLQYRITPIQQLKNIFFQGDPARQQELGRALPSLGVAVGLALQGLGRGRAAINLLPDDFIIRRELHRKRFSGLIAGALVWGTVMCFWVKENRTLTRATAIEGSGADTLKKVDALQVQMDEAMRGKNPTRLKMFEDFGKRREYYARIIGAIGMEIPTEVQLDAFRFSEAGEPGASGILAAAGMRAMAVAGPYGQLGGATGAPQVSAEARRFAESKMFLSFTATCDARLESIQLAQRLPRHLKDAVVYQKIKLVREVVVGTITRKGEVELVEPGAPPRMQLTAPVTVALKAPDEVDAELAELAKKAAQEAAAEAAKKSAAPAGEAPAIPGPASSPQ